MNSKEIINNDIQISRVLWTPEKDNMKAYYSIESKNWPKVLFSHGKIKLNRQVKTGDSGVIRASPGVMRKVTFRNVENKPNDEFYYAQISLDAFEMYWQWSYLDYKNLNNSRTLDWEQVVKDGCYEFVVIYSYSKNADGAPYHLRMSVRNDSITRVNKIPDRSCIVFGLDAGALIDGLGFFPNNEGGGFCDLTPWIFLDDTTKDNSLVSSKRIVSRILKKNVKMIEETPEKRCTMKKIMYSFPEALTYDEIPLDQRIICLQGEKLITYCMVLGMCWTDEIAFLRINTSIHESFPKIEVSRYIGMRDYQYVVFTVEQEIPLTDSELLFEMRAKGRKEPWFLENIDVYRELIMTVSKLDYIMVAPVLVDLHGQSYWHPKRR
jgi:hypothetical protein